MGPGPSCNTPGVSKHQKGGRGAPALLVWHHRGSDIIGKLYQVTSPSGPYRTGGPTRQWEEPPRHKPTPCSDRLPGFGRVGRILSLCHRPVLAAGQQPFPTPCPQLPYRTLRQASERHGITASRVSHVQHNARAACTKCTRPYAWQTRPEIYQLCFGGRSNAVRLCDILSETYWRNYLWHWSCSKTPVLP